MATTFSYTYKAHIPLQQGFADESSVGTSLFFLEITGPATSVSAGMTIASITTDLTKISKLWEVGQGSPLYKIRWSPATANAAATGKVLVDLVASGVLVTSATNLSTVKWNVAGIGSGPLASAID